MGSWNTALSGKLVILKKGATYDVQKKVTRSLISKTNKNKTIVEITWELS